MGKPRRLRLLLDTHVWIWALLQPEQIATDTSAVLEDSANELWLSPVSVWELLMLAERGRLELDGPPTEWVSEAFEAWPMRDAPMNRAVALRSRSLDLEHEDPADRFIASSALEYDLVLVTRDTRLLASREVAVLRA